MFLGLVKQKLKNVCSASNDQGTNPQNPEKKKTHTRTRKSGNLVVLGSFLLFLGFQNSSRFVYVSVVLRFSQKHTCLEQSESFFGLFDLSS
jgi:hypothetical protein